MHEELSPSGFTLVSVALDRDPERVRPWIERAAPTHPALVDRDFVVADLYNMVNVPTVVWVDEGGRIVRPNDVAYATDTFTPIHGIDPRRCLAALRAWVEHGETGVAAERLHELTSLPTETDQRARAEFALGRLLLDRGEVAAAERHVRVAGELAPHDFTIRRGSMPMLGVDPMGPAFREMVMAWVGAGNPYYRPLPD